LTLVKSEYLIVNEGDDYFTDPLKLQKQVDFLDKNTNFSICFHPVRVFFEDGSKKDEIFPSKKFRFGKSILDLNDLLNHNFIQTNSCVYKWRFGIKEKIEDFLPKNIMPGDYFLHLLHAQKGKIGYINEVMAEYRMHSAGIWYCKSKRILTYGMKILNFFLEVNKTIAQKSYGYRAKQLIPAARDIFSIYLKNRRYDEAMDILELVPEVADIIDSENKKISKLRKRIQILSIVCGFLAVIILFGSLYIFKF